MSHNGVASTALDLCLKKITRSLECQRLVAAINLKKKRVNISKLEPLKKVSLQIKKAVRQQYKTGQS